MSSVYAFYTTFLTLFPIGVIILFICQLLADKYGKRKIKDNIARTLLYCVYGSALACTLFGYSLHHSQDDPSWCQLYGIPPCFAVYGAAKAFIYAFFLRRARKANASNIHKSKCTQFLFDRVGPIYLVLYWIGYVTLASVLFSGRPINTGKPSQDIVSYCLFDSWELWFIIIANIVDFCNCAAALLLFLFPLLKSIKRLKNGNINNRLLIKFVRVMKWNVALSFTATFTSLLTASVVKASQEYIWLFCAGDPFVNSICAFLMIATNRRFIVQQCCKCVWHYDVTNEDQTCTSPASPPESIVVPTTTKTTISAIELHPDFMMDSVACVDEQNDTKPNKEKLFSLLSSDDYSKSIPTTHMQCIPKLSLKMSKSY